MLVEEAGAGSRRSRESGGIFAFRAGGRGVWAGRGRGASWRVGWGEVLAARLGGSLGGLGGQLACGGAPAGPPAPAAPPSFPKNGMAHLPTVNLSVDTDGATPSFPKNRYGATPPPRIRGGIPVGLRETRAAANAKNEPSGPASRVGGGRTGLGGRTMNRRRSGSARRGPNRWPARRTKPSAPG